MEVYSQNPISSYEYDYSYSEPLAQPKQFRKLRKPYRTPIIYDDYIVEDEDEIKDFDEIAANNIKGLPKPNFRGTIKPFIETLFALSIAATSSTFLYLGNYLLNEYPERLTRSIDMHRSIINSGALIELFLKVSI